MASHTSLPNGYSELAVIDLKEDKKTFLLINVTAIVLCVLLLVLGAFLEPFSIEIDSDHFFVDFILPYIVMIVGYVAYVILHEGVHGVFMYGFSKVKPKFGARLPWYFYAGSDVYFDKAQYIVIALAPVVIWGVVLFVIDWFCSGLWFWAVYVIQIGNIAGAAGDFFVTVKMLRYPAGILVQDTGTRMTVFVPKNGRTMPELNGKNQTENTSEDVGEDISAEEQHD